MGISKAFEIRIGINSGHCNVGNFGIALRMACTIIWREVNLTARLKQAAAPVAVLPTIKPDSTKTGWPLLAARFYTELGLRRAMGVKSLYGSRLTRFLKGRRDTTAMIWADGKRGGESRRIADSLPVGVAGQIGASWVPLDAGTLMQAIHKAQSRKVIEALNATQHKV